MSLDRYVETKKTTTAKKTTVSKPDLLTVPLFVHELTQSFQETPLIETATDLAAMFERMKYIPPKWTSNTARKFLLQEEIIIYSKKKPIGYSLNLNKLGVTQTGDSPSISISNQSVISPQASLAALDVIVPPPVRRKKTEKLVTSSSVPSSSGVAEISTPKPRRPRKTSSESSSVGSKKTKSSAGTAQTTTVISSHEEVAALLDKIPSFPVYLMERMNSSTRKALTLGVFEINTLSIDKLDGYIENLSSARIHFDNKYTNEMAILTAIDERIKYFSRILNQKQEQNAQVSIKNYFLVPLIKGKFDKIIARWGTKYDIQECAMRCIKKIGGKARKIPLSEYGLRQQIMEILREKYPNHKD